MSAFNRRAAIKGVLTSVAVPAVVSGCAIAPAAAAICKAAPYVPSPAVSASFPAIERVAAAHRAWSAATTAADAITTKLHELKAAGQPLVSIEFAGATVELRSHKAILRFFRRAREGQGASTPALGASETQLHAAFDAERARIDAAREHLGIAAVESHVAEARQALLAAQGAAARTVPTTVEGLRALIELAGRLPVHDHDQMKAALGSMRVAAMALLPEATR